MQKKYLLIVASVFAVVLLIVSTIITLVLHKISSLSTTDVERLIAKQFGGYATIEKIQPRWRGLSLVVQIEHLTLRNQQESQQLLQAEYIAGKLNFWQTLSFSIAAALSGKVTLPSFLQLDVDLRNVTFSEQAKIMQAQLGIRYSGPGSLTNVTVQDLIYANTNIFVDPIHINSVYADLSWQAQEHKILLGLENCAIDLPGLQIKADIAATMQAGQLIDFMFHGITDAIAVEVAHKYVPTKLLPPELSAWIASAVQGGEILSNSLVFSRNKLDWMMNFKDVTLAYAPGWPALENLAGNLHLTEKQITVVGVSGKILTTPIAMVTASVDGLDRPGSFPLIVESTVDASVQQGMEFLLASPLLETGQMLAGYQPAGNMQLDLQLAVPLIDTTEDSVKINGKVKLQAASLQDPEYAARLDDISGVIDFTQQTITAKQLRLNLLNKPATAEVAYDKRKPDPIKVHIKTNLQADLLTNLFPALASFQLSGGTDVSLTAGVPMRQGEKKSLAINSDLLGLAVDLPYPLGKTAKATGKFSAAVAHDDNLRLHLQYGKAVGADLIFAANSLQQGKIVLGKNAAMLTAKDCTGVQIQGNLKHLDLQEWLQLFAGNNARLKLPIQIDLMLDKLTAFDTHFNAVHLRYSTATGTLLLDGANIVGKIASAADGTITANFSKMLIADAKATAANTTQLKPDGLLALKFTCDDLTLRGSPIGRVGFQLKPNKDGYEIVTLEINNQDFTLQANGSWQLGKLESTSLIGQVSSKNFGTVFKAWGFGNSISNSAGEMGFKFAWSGSPMHFKISAITGSVNLALQAGKIRGVNPGLGRVIGLLSLDNIQRRLKLDFSDCVGRGFVFDTLQASFQLKRGALHTDGIFIDGPSSYIALTGDADITSRQINCKMGVVPKVGASLPLAAAITAGNPAIGAAFWILNKATSSQAQSTATPRYRYTVTGSWDDPKISEKAVTN